MSTTQASPGTTTCRTAAGWRTPLSPAVLALVAFLALQLLAALILGLGGNGMEPAGTQGPLLAFDPDRVTGIRIDAPEMEQVLVTKTGTGWAIPALGDLPAAGSRVSDLLTKLGGLEKGLPVATSEEALERFRVGDDIFERRLTLEREDLAPTVLYLGDSPGFRRLFVRVQGDNAVYEARLGLFDAPEKADAWSDRTLLHLETATIQRLTLGGLSLDRVDGGWRLVDLAEGEQQDAVAVGDLARTLTTIDFVGVLTPKDQPTISQVVPPIEIGATLESGETVSYRVSKLGESDDYLLEVSNRPQRFKIAAYSAEALTNIERGGLLQEPETAAADGDGSEPLPQIPTSDDGHAQSAAKTAELQERQQPDTGDVPYPAQAEDTTPASSMPGEPGSQPGHQSLESTTH